MAIFGMMLAAAHMDPDVPPTASEMSAQVWLGAVNHGLIKYLEGRSAAAGSSFVSTLLGLFAAGEVDPLVLDLRGNGLNLEAKSAGTPYFDFAASGMAANSAWIGAGTGFLAVPGPDGLVHDGTGFVDTFAQLQALDSNGDGVIDDYDPIFDQLVVWQDLNGDGICQANEVSTLVQLGVVNIALDAVAADAIINGSTVLETATATMADGTTREIAQVALNVSTIYTCYVGPEVISAAAAQLPQIQGYGTLMDLRHAMSAAPQLFADIQALLSVDPADTSAYAIPHSPVHEGAGNRKFRHIAPSTEELQALVHYLALQFSRQQFRDRRVHGIEFIAQVQLNATINEHALHR